jgi:hypothetical protein
MPERHLVLVTDSGFSALEFLAALLRQEVTCYALLLPSTRQLRRGTPAPSGAPGPQVSACRPWPGVG